MVKQWILPTLLVQGFCAVLAAHAEVLPPSAGHALDAMAPAG
ncbi:MAG: hypothetical protein FD130_1344, partial [Halothiobacillaceae bacterium]